MGNPIKGYCINEYFYSDQFLNVEIYFTVVLTLYRGKTTVAELTPLPLAVYQTSLSTITDASGYIWHAVE